MAPDDPQRGPVLGHDLPTQPRRGLLPRGGRPDAGQRPEALIQSFGAEPQVVVEHCLAANGIRKARDARLSTVIVLCGLLFLPGMLVWLLGFQIRTTVAKAENKQAGALGTAVLVAIAALAVLFVKMPFSGFRAWYARAAGRPAGRRLVLGQADLRGHGEGPAEALGRPPVGQRRRRQGPRGGPQQPGRDRGRAAAPVPGQARRRAAVQLGLLRRPQGHARHGHPLGQLAARREPGAGRPDPGDPPFRSWDVVRAIHDQLRMLERGPLNTGGLTKPSIRHWVVTPIGENAKAVSRPEGTDVEAYQVKSHAIQDISQQAAVRRR